MSLDLSSPERDRFLIGPVRLLPIQSWFFEQNWDNLNFFNQSALFEVEEGVSFESIRVLWKVLTQYHDIFRVTYKKCEDGYRQYYTDLSSVEVQEVDIRSSSGLYLEEMYEHMNLTQRSLDIFNKKVGCVVLYRCPRKKTFMFVIFHHLVIDGVSWRILMDDFESIYRDLSNGGGIFLPAKTFSYRQWGDALKSYSSSEGLSQEKKYWEKVIRAVKEDTLSNKFANFSGASKTSVIQISFSGKETWDLLHTVLSRYDAQINDLLLTALTLSLGTESGDLRANFNLEGHGRESVIGLDVSRTIGWFTTVFPVSLSITNDKNLRGAVDEIKEQIRNIPEKGIGYSILKYYRKELDHVVPKVSFNYLGQWDSSVRKNSWFSYAKESSNFEVFNESVKENLIDINAEIKDFVLRINFEYKIDGVKRSFVQNIADSFKRNLLCLMDSVL